ncbi:MAG: metallophosphoesterase family protein, partial [Myxococcota bacterium]|nr:metallophosphoesterase family protein [Myxococcota bacterium]
MNARVLPLLLALVLAAAPASAQFVRTPYLQTPTETSIVVAWRSTAAQTSAVCWGASPSALTNRAGSAASTTDHAVSITGLTADTQYYYSVASPSCPPATAGDARDTFRTAPPRGSERPFRMWVVGDSGTGGTRQRAVQSAMLAATTDRRPDLFLHMGDMAYSSGTTTEFTTRFFDIYADVLRQTPCWPTMGNHEGASSDSGTETGPYYEGYVLPTDGRAGGLASGTEAYYSFDWANVHFVVLDSHDSPRGTTGAMLTWLAEDLAAADATWLVVYFHHPPYTDGSHDSDREGQLIDMRQNALPILEAHGVDLVLGGHSHIYERSYLLRGAYDTPTTLSGHVADMGDGRLDGDGAYRSGVDGTVYIVAGHGGAGTSGSAAHPVMYFSEVDHGSCLIDVDGDVMHLRNIRWDGEETDHLTLVKRDGIFLARPMAGERYLAGSTVSIAWSSIGPIASVTLESSLDGGATWSVLADGTENDGLFDWATPRRATELARVRIRDAGDAAIMDESGDFALSSEARVTVVGFGDTWEYSDDGTDHGDAWRAGEGGPWSEGRAQLGYGDGDEATVLNDASPNVPTVYFRRRFELTSEATYARIRAIYDDGIAVWVNGQLVTQANVDELGFAAFASGGSEDNASLDTTLDLAAGNPFVVGENWIAAVAKQSSATSSDLSFDLELELGVRVMLDPDVDGGV